jgi:hypothetical protein
MNELTREELLLQVAALKAQLAAVPAQPPYVVEEVSGPADSKPPPGKTSQTAASAAAALKVGAARDLLARRARGIKSTPEEVLGQIAQITTVITSGVNSAGYGDKRTEFRSLSELRQILADLEEQLDDLLGRGGRVRQFRMTTSADKAL